MNRQRYNRAYKPSVKVEISMDVLSDEILAIDGEVKLINKFKSGLYQLSLYKKIVALSTKWKKVAVNEEAIFNYENLEAGKYKFRWSVRRDSFVTRGLDRCRSEVLSSEGVILKSYRGGSGLVIVKIKPEYGKTKLRIRCFNFERTKLKTSDIQSVWKMELLPDEVVYKPLASNTIQL